MEFLVDTDRDIYKLIIKIKISKTIIIYASYGSIFQPNAKKILKELKKDICDVCIVKVGSHNQFEHFMADQLKLYIFEKEEDLISYHTECISKFEKKSKN